MKTKTIKVSAHSSEDRWARRPFYVKSVEDIIESEAKKGYVLISNVPVAEENRETTHYLLTFQKQ